MNDQDLSKQIQNHQQLTSVAPENLRAIEGGFLAKNGTQLANQIEISMYPSAAGTQLGTGKHLVKGKPIRLG